MCLLSCAWSRGRCLSFLVKEASCACCAVVSPVALCSLSAVGRPVHCSLCQSGKVCMICRYQFASLCMLLKECSSSSKSQGRIFLLASIESRFACLLLVLPSSPC
ncbi:AraC family transcriptional regulator [Sesbania bispinosa]|nr:AraC family transcriptional regulator [Sesbania bispinosa]